MVRVNGENNLVTGAAGFIGAALTMRLLAWRSQVGLDNLKITTTPLLNKRDFVRSRPWPYPAPGGLSALRWKIPSR